MIKQRAISQASIHVMCIAIALLSLYPFLFMMITSFKDMSQFFHSYFGLTFPLHVSNYVESWNMIGGTLLNSVVISAASVSLIVVLAVLAAYSFARYKFWGKEFLFMMVLVLLMVPGVLTLIPTFVLIRDLGLLNTRLGLVLIYLTEGQVLAILILRSFFASIPQELVDAARMDGASELQCLGKIFVPLSKPILATVSIMNVLFVWNDYIWPLITISSERLWTSTVALVYIESRYAMMGAWGPLFAGYVIASLPLIILFCFSVKYFVAGLTSGALKA